ncbi:Heterokaryon incompatibility protein 6, OR allele [Fusarium austroafricanum]|uniref:Heterokaryon incompatibility protein 6, OR allele n=1 Tax=Fusarium austroafricanum TaxID=2364996 RepID=A0A8H4KXG7_9HYPO|nr:Heterokaryon incompatibility protein 6, OR allele [Fusarium austroafricanum]
MSSADVQTHVISDLGFIENNFDRNKALSTGSKVGISVGVGLGQLVRAISQGATTYKRHQPLNRPLHQWYSSQSTRNSRYKVPRPKPTFRNAIWISVGVLAWGQVFASYVYEPLRDSGVFSEIAKSTIFRAIPPKLCQPTEQLEDKLYQPITRDNEIRLLVLEPGELGNELDCQLIHAELSWRTKFEALSYAWGDDTTVYRLKCSGRDIGVRANLHDALLDLRHPRQKRILWVDALCINQDDNDEKSEQIMLMNEIYSQAQGVLIYLGKSDSSVEGAIASMRWLDWKLTPLYIRQFFLSAAPGTSSFFIDGWTQMQPIDRQGFSWSPIISLLHRPWFQRTWVIQEAVIPTHAQVICGDESISWAKFMRVVDAIKLYQSSVRTVPGYHSITDTISSMDLIRSARDNRHPKIDWRLYRQFLPGSWMYGKEDAELLDLILMSRKYQCSYPHDKIFGMLGVTVQDTGSKYLKPDYSISSSTAFRNYVLWEVLHNRSLRVLGTSSDQTLGPSWVPDFSRLDPIESLTGPVFRQSDFNASAGLPLTARTSDNNYMLRIQGSIVDTIHTVGENSFKDRSVVFSERRQRGKRISVHDQLRVNIDIIEEAKDIWLEASKGLARGLGPAPATEGIFTAPTADGRLPVSPGWEPFLRTLFGDICVGS